MYFDYFTAAALADELTLALVGGRVQDIVEIDALSLGFEIFNAGKRHYLYLTADPEKARIHLTEGKLRRGVTQPSPLGLLLNRYIEGARVLAIRQPAWERILLIDFMTPESEFTLVIEPIERRANLVLVEGGIIRECARRVGVDENRVRQLLPGRPYEAPPPQEKIAPEQVRLEDMKRLLDSDPEAQAQQSLTRGIHGFSPLLAREVVFDATGKVKALAGDTYARDLFESYQMVLAPLLARQWQPGFTVEEGEIASYAAYRLTHRPGWLPAPSMSAAMEKFYGVVSGDEAYEAAKKPIRKQLKDAEKRLSGKLHSLERQQRDEGDIERLRQSGELLLAYQYVIQPRQTQFSEQYDPDALPLLIKLDPDLTPLENAKRYFEKYEKAKRSRQNLPALIEASQSELDYLAQLEVDLDLANNWPEIGEVQEALQSNGYWRGEKRRPTAGTPSGPMRVVTDDATVIWVGRNARQNEEVTFKKGTPEDLWMHAQGVPGAHVIIKNAGRSVDKKVLEQAASYAAYYSKGRTAGAVEVIVTERKHLRKVKGGKPGMVQVMKQSHPTIRATPRPVKDDER